VCRYVGMRIVASVTVRAPLVRRSPHEVAYEQRRPHGRTLRSNLPLERGSPKYEKAALRWLECYLTEARRGFCSSRKSTVCFRACSLDGVSV
jgi:hypothetical protein